MVEETIQTIKETEKEAEALVKAAEDKCAGILEHASEEAKRLKETTIADAQTKAKEAMGAAREAGKATTEEALAKVEKEIAALKEEAGKKEAQAIKAVIEHLV